MKSYSFNRRKRQEQNRTDNNHEIGTPIAGEKSPAVLARIARRSVRRRLSKEQKRINEALKLAREALA